MKKIPYIVIDGIDGSGKTTQVNMLIERAQVEGRMFRHAHEPGGTPFAEKMRNVFNSKEGENTSARTQFLWMWASRSDLLEKVVTPALEQGIPVISERSDSSTFAYQALQLDDFDWFWQERIRVFGSHDPTIYIIIDIPGEESKRRVDADTRRSKTPFDMKPVEWYERVREGFLLFSRDKRVSAIVISGAQSPELIHEEIYQIVAEHCGWK